MKSLLYKMIAVAALAGVVAVGCKSGAGAGSGAESKTKTKTKTETEAKTEAGSGTGTGTVASGTGAGTGSGTGTGTVASGTGTGTGTVASGTGSGTGAGAGAGAGRDFIGEAKALFRLAACAGDAALPPKVRESTWKRHCRLIERRMAQYRKLYIGKMKPFVAKLQPKKGLPDVVVYPFGGGDLLSALLTYPDAREITSMSLEQVGDPRRVLSMDDKTAADSLKLLRKTIDGLLALDDSTSVNLMKMQRGAIPGQLAFFLVALAVHGYVPVSLRYFELADDGTVRYVDAARIAELDKKRARRLSSGWTNPDFSPAFRYGELRFRRAGAADAKVQVHRHLGANLSNGVAGKSGFYKGSPLMRHLERKGRVKAMTKAATYLLWRPGFSNIRNYVINNVVFMISDSTGLSPLHARRAGFRYRTYGRFDGAFFKKRAKNRHSLALMKVYKRQPRRAIPMRYGYPDVDGHPHMMVVYKKNLGPQGAK